jgi:hypothetical protein
MKAILIYSQHSSKEIELADNIIAELGEFVETINVEEHPYVKTLFQFRATPALLLLREDLQGDYYLEEDMADNLLRTNLEINNAMEIEQKAIREIPPNRIDHIVKTKVVEKMGEYFEVMHDMAQLLLEEGVV